jgi:hypothetical protein
MTQAALRTWSRPAARGLLTAGLIFAGYQGRQDLAEGGVSQ